jgi:hypothetical protein
MAIISFEEAAERTWTHVGIIAVNSRNRSRCGSKTYDSDLHDGVLEVVAPSDYVGTGSRHYVEMIQSAAGAAGLPVTGISEPSLPRPLRCIGML